MCAGVSERVPVCGVHNGPKSDRPRDSRRPPLVTVGTQVLLAVRDGLPRLVMGLRRAHTRSNTLPDQRHCRADQRHPHPNVAHANIAHAELAHAFDGDAFGCADGDTDGRADGDTDGRAVDCTEDCGGFLRGRNRCRWPRRMLNNKQATCNVKRAET